MFKGDALESRLQTTFDFCCPPPASLESAEVDALEELISCIKRDGSDTSHPIGTVGLELKVALILIGRKSGPLRGDNSFWLRKCHKLFARPAVEPILLANWDKLSNFQITELQLGALCSLLCGTDQYARSGESFGLDQQLDVRFEEAELAKSWWSDIQRVANTPELEHLLPTYVYARTIMAHPFPDGNGRLARALLLSSLASKANLQAPVIALAPAFYKNAAAIADGLRTLSRDSDWGAMTWVLVRVLREAMEMSRSGRKIEN